MHIAQAMTHPVRTLRPLDSIRFAREVMETHRINQLPVVVGGHVVGIVTDRDLRDAFPSVFESASERAWNGRERHAAAADPGTIPVEVVMTPHVLTLGPRDSLADAACIMRRERIGAIPIVDRGRLVGIVTRADVLRVFVDLETEGSARHDARGIASPVAASA